MQTLTVINNMLATLGETPLNSITDEHSFKGAALDTLDRFNDAVQARGRWYNTETLTIDPNPVDGSIAIPGDTLEVRSDDSNYVQRGGRLYNLDGGTYVFTSPVTLRIIRRVTFEDLPETEAQHIAAMAVLSFQSNFDGDTAKTRLLSELVGDTKPEANKSHIRGVRANLLTNNYRLARIKSGRRL